MTTETVIAQQALGHWIAGALAEPHSDRTAPVYDPALGVETRRVALADQEDIDAAVAGAKAAFPAWRGTPLSRRQAISFRFRELLNERKPELAEIITAEQGMHKVFFTNGGADANENAIRMARLVTGRDKVISRYRSYHGNTGAAIVATGDWRRVPNEYARGHVHTFGP